MGHSAAAVAVGGAGEGPSLRLQLPVNFIVGHGLGDVARGPAWVGVHGAQPGGFIVGGRVARAHAAPLATGGFIALNPEQGSGCSPELAGATRRTAPAA